MLCFQYDASTGKKFLGVEDWVYFEGHRDVLELVEAARESLTYLLACRLERAHQVGDELKWLLWWRGTDGVVFFSLIKMIV